MKFNQYLWQDNKWDKKEQVGEDCSNPQLILVFGERMLLEDKVYFDQLRDMYPDANIVISSTSGEIIGNEVLDDSIVATAIEFEKTELSIKVFSNEKLDDSFETGESIARHYNDIDVKGLLVLSDGNTVNGSDLLHGINETLNNNVIVTGGLAGDKARFEKTLVGLNQLPTIANIVVIGFVGENISINTGSRGGWDTFGPIRKITRSDKNILKELDGESALELYKSYLGDRAKDLPGSALVIPLLLMNEQHPEGVVRTILGVSDEEDSMTFAGNMPEGSTVQLMKANFDKIIDGSAGAAKEVAEEKSEPELAILISCVGRKLVLGQLTGEEVEEAVSAIGNSTVYTGFYSYGELSPSIKDGACLLHNQTMTITTFSEKMMENVKYKRILRRQIRSHFGSEENIPEELIPFINSINEAYIHYDNDRGLLERSLSISTGELQDKNEMLRSSNEALDDFNHSISHDLKTHVVNTISLVKMLVKYLEKKDFKKIDIIIERLTNTGTQFQKLINDFLKISKFEKQLGSEVESINIESYINELKTEFSPVVESKDHVSLKFSYNGIESIRFPKEQLNSIIRNLITNAIKYGKPNEKVNVKVNFSRKDNDVFEISVADNGIGIDLVRNKEKMFKMFSRLDKFEDIEGTGVGLFLSKKLIEKNNGEIKVKSELGVGTSFTVLFKGAIKN